MNIALDIDGVIIDFVRSFNALVKKRLDYDLKYEDLYCHDIGQVLGIPKADVNKLLSETLENNHFDLMDQAKESIDYLKDHHYVFLITGRDESYRERTVDLLKEHEIHYEELYFSRYLEKHHVDVHFDVFIEDSVEEAIGLSREGSTVLLMSHPWNVRTLNLKSLFKRVNNWKDIVKEIDRLSLK